MAFCLSGIFISLIFIISAFTTSIDIGTRLEKNNNLNIHNVLNIKLNTLDQNTYEGRFSKYHSNDCVIQYKNSCAYPYYHMHHRSLFLFAD